MKKSRGVHAPGKGLGGAVDFSKSTGRPEMVESDTRAISRFAESYAWKCRSLFGKLSDMRIAHGEGCWEKR